MTAGIHRKGSGAAGEEEVREAGICEEKDDPKGVQTGRWLLAASINGCAERRWLIISRMDCQFLLTRMHWCGNYDPRVIRDH